MARKYLYHGSPGKVKTVKAGTQVFDLHGARMKSLAPTAATKVHYRTRGPKLLTGAIISDKKLRSHGYTHQLQVGAKTVQKTKGGGRILTQPVKPKKSQRVEKKELLSNYNIHHVDTSAWHHRDAKRKRSWIKGQRIHHGAYAFGTGAAGAGLLRVKHPAAKAFGGALALTSAHLIKDDWKDRKIWFQPGTQHQGTSYAKNKGQSRRRRKK